MPTRPTGQERAALAQQCCTVAADLGGLLMRLHEVSRDRWPVVAQEEAACNRLLWFGDQLLSDLRTVAMRLDRAALVRSREG